MDELTVEKIAEQLKLHCPGEAFHADNKTHAELIANRFMDFTAHLLTALANKEEQIGKCFNENDSIGMENLSLKKQLANKERETAVTVKKLAVNLKLGGNTDYNGALTDLCHVINTHFGLDK